MEIVVKKIAEYSETETIICDNRKDAEKEFYNLCFEQIGEDFEVEMSVRFSDGDIRIIKTRNISAEPTAEQICFELLFKAKDYVQKFGNYGYYKKGNKCLRLKDHSCDPSNFAIYNENCTDCLSIVIADVDATKGKFGELPEHITQIRFNEANTWSEIKEAIDDFFRLKQLRRGLR